jgi:hypothetical protein
VEKKTGEPIFPLEFGSHSRHRSCCVCKCSPFYSLAGRGGEEGAAVVDLLKQLPRCLPCVSSSSERNTRRRCSPP